MHTTDYFFMGTNKITDYRISQINFNYYVEYKHKVLWYEKWSYEREDNTINHPISWILIPIVMCMIIPMILLIVQSQKKKFWSEDEAKEFIKKELSDEQTKQKKKKIIVAEWCNGSPVDITRKKKLERLVKK